MIGEGFQYESNETPEEVTSRIELDFFRHGEKGKGASDEEVRLTETGRAQAIGKSEDGDISQSVAFGSPKKRTQETAGFVMAGQVPEITGDESLEELEEKLNEGRDFGSKIGVDKRLGFGDDFSTPLGVESLAAFKRGEYLKFLVEQSDRLAEEVGDKDGDTYSRFAGRIAGIVKKYITMAPRWDRLVQDESKHYESTLKRFLGTHQGVAESFLAKVIEQTKGVSERDAFVSAIGTQGFDFVEGFSVEIETTNTGEQKLRVSFIKEKDGDTIFEYDEEVPIEVIDSLASVK